MTNILETILPIFIIILIGWSLRRFDFMPDGFLKPANRLVFFVAIPAMIFREIAQAALVEHFRPVLILATLCPLVLVSLAGLMLVRRFDFQRRQVGTFLQCSFHGNLGYIGLAVAFYFLGTEGFTKASIVAGFLMLFQNLLAVVVLSRFNADPEARSSLAGMFMKILLNPVVISAGGGMLFSLSAFELPLLIDRSLKILSGMALPMALLVIGTSLSFSQIRRQLHLTVIIGLFKLVFIPALGLTFFYFLGIVRAEYLPALILLASPTATVTYVMASEMAGDPDLATSAISITTLASALTLTLWLGLGS